MSSLNTGERTNLSENTENNKEKRKSKLKKPKLGDIVLYSDRGKLCPAIVVGLSSDSDTVDLSVFSNTYAGSKLKTEVIFSNGDIDGSWRWGD